MQSAPLNCSFGYAHCITHLKQTDVLDVTPACAREGTFFDGSVWIPIEELPHRVYELGPKSVPIHVIGGEAEAGVQWLQTSGRLAEMGIAGELTSSRPACRLWQPSSLLPTGQPGRALDIGCGSGRDAVHLASEGWHVTAMDVLPEALDMARSLECRYLENPSITFIEGDFRHATISEDFDLICMIRSYRPEFLPKAMKLLKPGGSVIIEAFARGRKQNVASEEELRHLLVGLEIHHLVVQGELIQAIAIRRH